MGHALPARGPVVDAEVVAVGRMVPVEDGLGLLHHRQQRQTLGVGGLEQRRKMPARDDHGVAGRDWKAIAVGDRQRVFGDDAVRLELTEGTGFGWGRRGHAWDVDLGAQSAPRVAEAGGRLQGLAPV